MSNKKYLYMGNEIEVTNETEEKIFYKQGNEFKSMPIANKADLQPISSENMQLARTVNNTFNELTKGLLNDFEKLSSDASYVGQAKQRSETVKTIIDMFKVQISMKG